MDLKRISDDLIQKGQQTYIFASNSLLFHYTFLFSYSMTFSQTLDKHTFYGTSLSNFHSIAKYGLKKAGDTAGDKPIKIVDGHSENESWLKTCL